MNHLLVITLPTDDREVAQQIARVLGAGLSVQFGYQRIHSDLCTSEAAITAVREALDALPDLGVERHG